MPGQVIMSVSSMVIAYYSCRRAGASLKVLGLADCRRALAGGSYGGRERMRKRGDEMEMALNGSGWHRPIWEQEH